MEGDCRSVSSRVRSCHRRRHNDQDVLEGLNRSLQLDGRERLAVLIDETRSARVPAIHLPTLSIDPT